MGSVGPTRGLEQGAWSSPTDKAAPHAAGPALGSHNGPRTPGLSWERCCVSCPRGAPASTVLLGGAEVRGNGALASWAAPCARGPVLRDRLLQLVSPSTHLLSRPSTCQGQTQADVAEQQWRERRQGDVREPWPPRGGAARSEQTARGSRNSGSRQLHQESQGWTGRGPAAEREVRGDF